MSNDLKMISHWPKMLKQGLLEPVATQALLLPPLMEAGQGVLGSCPTLHSCGQRSSLSGRTCF